MTQSGVYSREFKQEVIRLLETSGRNSQQLEKELGIGEGSLAGWRQELLADSERELPDDCPLLPEEEERLQQACEKETLQLERERLRRAIAIFSLLKA